MRITTKGQVTIPLEIREQLGLLPNTEVDFVLDGDGVRIVKAGNAKPTRARDIVTHLRGRATGGMTTDELMRLLRG